MMHGRSAYRGSTPNEAPRMDSGRCGGDKIAPGARKNDFDVSGGRVMTWARFGVMNGNERQRENNGFFLCGFGFDESESK